MGVSLKRSLYRGGISIGSGDYIELISKIWSPSVSFFKRDDLTIYNVLSQVRLQLSVGKDKFTIEWKDHLRVLTFFETISTWFYDTSMNDLFFHDEKGNYCFNGKYNSLKANAFSGYGNAFMESRPALIEKDNKQYEGVILSINNYESSIGLLVKDVLELSSILHTFNFSSELALYMQLAQNLNVPILVDSRSGGFTVEVNSNRVDLQEKNSDPFNLRERGFMNS